VRRAVKFSNQVLRALSLAGMYDGRLGMCYAPFEVLDGTFRIIIGTNAALD
jgi:hypothetical protein